MENKKGDVKQSSKRRLCTRSTSFCVPHYIVVEYNIRKALFNLEKHIDSLIHNKFGISANSWESGRHAGGFSLCGNAREKEVKCGSLPQNAGELATMW